MNTKKWYQSYTVWFNIIMTVLGIVAGLQGLESFKQYAEVFVVITIIGNTFLRVWFTEKKIK